ncbi:MAG: glycosyl hydrolase family 28-related protein, partial [Nitrososphaera sp.]
MQTIWLSPTDYVSGDSSLRISYPSVSHPNTTVTSTTKGDLKWISLGLRLPPHVRVEEVIVCYQVLNARSFISQVRLVEMNTPDRAVVIHDDGTDLQSTAPVCYSSNVGGKVPTPGTAVTLALRLNFQDKTDRIMLGAVGIRIAPLAECSLNVRDFGAKGDTRKVSDGEITAGTTELSSATAGFTPDDVGKRIGIARAGVSGLDADGNPIMQPLSTTIATFVSDRQVTLTDAASTTISNANVTWGTDDWRALQAAFDAASPTGAMICVPPGTYLISNFLSLRSKTYLKGAGASSLFTRAEGGTYSIFSSERVDEVTVEAIA